jgi:hypothetical protein
MEKFIGHLILVAYLFLSPLLLQVPHSINTGIYLTDFGRCRACPYFVSEQNFDIFTNHSITISSLKGGGRTGNVYIALRKAIIRAHECKFRLILPGNGSDEELLKVSDYRFFDFTNRSGEAHPDCHNSTYGYGLHGNIRDAWFIPSLPSESEVQLSFFRSYNNEIDILQSCLMEYMGICSNEFCEEVSYLDDQDVLVAHIRQGDIFSNYIHPRYGQPPLSYYLRAFSIKSWKRIIMVSGDPRYGKSPIWDMMQILNESQALFKDTKIEFQSSNWGFDFKTLVCARNLVESNSSMAKIWRLGFWSRIYSFKCFVNSTLDREVYNIKIKEPYAPFINHDNSPKELLEMVLHPSEGVVKC